MFKNNKKRSIKYRLTFGYMVSMCISVIITIVLFSTVMRGYTDAKLYENDLSNTKLFYSYIEKQIEDIKLVSNNIVTSNALQQRIRDKEITKEYSMEINKIVTTYDAIRSIYIISNENSVDAFNNRDWYQVFQQDFINSVNTDILDRLKGRILCEIKTNEYIGDNENSIFLSRAIISNETLNVIGYLIIDISNDYLNEVYRDFVQSTQMEYLISDEYNNTILLSTRKELKGIEDIVLNLGHGTVGYKKIIYKGHKYNIIQRNAKILNGKITAIVYPVSYIGENVWMIVIIIIINICFAFIYFKLVKTLVLKPIHEITDSIEGIVGEANLDAKFEVAEENYEIDKISIALNSMMDQVNGLVDQVRQEHIMQRRLELDLLTNHVKPHFLFNVLNVARALITLKKYDDAKRLLNVISQYYRSWLNKGEDVITLNEELGILKYYVEIMKIRGAEEFNIKYDIDEELLNLKIPKLILQPLVENSFKYGLKDDEVLSIKIIIKRIDNNRIVIEVRDNGVGIDEETIERIYSGCDLGRESGFGMRSILERLCLYYGERNPRNIVKIKSEVDKFTTIMIVLNEDNIRTFI